jgi:hypothetical protein
MRDVASGSVLAVLAVVYFLGARALPSGQGEPGPVFLPYLLSAILLGLALVIIARGIRKRQSVDGALVRPAGLIVLTILYAFSFTPIGFLVSTLLYAAGVVLLLRQRGWRLLVIPVATTAFIYAAFVLGLGVALP